MRTTSQVMTALCLCLFAACSGGGSGTVAAGDGTPPTILFASFVGASATPSAGDSLALTLSEDIALVSGELLDSDDVVLSDGSLAVSAMARTSARVITLTLANGVSFSPGTTTISFSSSASAVQDLKGNLGSSGAPVTIATGDAESPVISQLTLNGTQDELNGTGPAGGTLQTPQSGFTIDLSYSDTTSALSDILLSANVPVTANGSVVFPGSELSSLMTLGTTATSAELSVPASVVFPIGTVTLTAWVLDATRRPSAPATFSFQVANATDQIRPFERKQLWFIDLSRDIESFTATAIGGSVTGITVNNASNSVTDLQDLFAIVGLSFGSPITNVSGSLNSNQVVMDRWKSHLVSELNSLFSAVSISFTFASPGTFPSTSPRIAYASLGWSQIAIAGAPSSSPSGILGAAIFDPNNQTQEDNSLTDLNGARLGVFMHTAVRFGYLSGPSTMFRMTYDPLTPSIGGIPIGKDLNDGNRLNGTLSDTRATAIDNAIRRLAKMAAVTVAHECGHSMGLVSNGAMPSGLYGNNAVNFPLSGGQPSSNADGHIENSSLFPSGSQNVMSPAIDFDSAQSSSTTFNSLNISYLRERALYDIVR